MKRTAHPPLSRAGQEALASYEYWLREREDLAAASIRNYLSDLHHFIAWYEQGVTVFWIPPAQQECNRLSAWSRRADAHLVDEVMPG